MIGYAILFDVPGGTPAGLQSSEISPAGTPFESKDNLQYAYRVWTYSQLRPYLRGMAVQLTTLAASGIRHQKENIEFDER